MSRLRTPPTENRDNDSVSKTPPAMPERVLTLQQRAFRELQNDNMRLNNDIDSLNNDIDSLSEQVSKCNEDRNKVSRELKVLEREYANLNRRIVNLRNQFVITKWKSRVERSRAIREMEKLDSEAKASRRKFIELKRREVARKQAEADQRQSEETRGKIWDGTKWVTKGAAEVLGSVAAGLIGGVVGVGLGGAMAGYDYIKGKSKAEEKDDKANRRAATRKVPATPAGSPPKQPLDSNKEKDDWEEDNGTEWDPETIAANIRAALYKDTSTPAPRGVPYRQGPRFKTPAQTPTPRVVQKTPRFQTPAGPPPKRSLDSVQEENVDDEMRERIIQAMKGKSETQGGLNLPAIKKILIEDGMDKQQVNKMKTKEARAALKNIL